MSTLVGQTPRKLFNVPHPPRFNHGLSTLPLGTLHGIEEDHNLLTQSVKTAARGKPCGSSVLNLR